MTSQFLNARASRLSPTQSRPERLVGIGFRFWLGGYASGNIDSWETAWNLYATELGACRARVAVQELGLWVGKIKDVSGRKITTLPPHCPGFCRDECVAISMVAASQHKVCPAMRACAFALIGCSDMEELLSATDRFAVMLDALDQRLSPNSICTVPDLACPVGAVIH
jgi:hypothetical protein